MENSAVSIETPKSSARRNKESVVYFGVNDNPPWYLCVLLGFQHFLTAFGATFSYPLLMSRSFCMEGDTVGQSELMGTVLFVSGLTTFLQSTFGVRLPIVQSCSYSYITPIVALLALPQWKCPYPYDDKTAMANLTSLSLPQLGSSGHKELWLKNLREVQGAILLSSLLQIVVGFSGLIGLLLNFIGPLTIAPTIALIGLSLFDVASQKSQGQWWIAIATMVLIAIFSQYLHKVKIPCITCNRRCERRIFRFPLFTLFPVLFAIAIAWGLCGILTRAGALPTDPRGWGYSARTDTKLNVLFESSWFRFPYPGQWGVPTVSVAGVLGTMAAVVASMIESVGDYYACARLANAPPPPGSAVSRGIGMEGITCLLGGAWGSGGGNTSYSENVGVIGITKVGSRLVIQVGAVLMLLLGCLGKFNALFVTIPDPVVGGMFIVMFGMVTAVGISNLQHVNINSPRNLFIFGISIFFGLSAPKWVTAPANANAIKTGNVVVDQILFVLCGTSMFVGGTLAFILDNTIPGTKEERGILHWRQDADEDSKDSVEEDTTYHLPCCQSLLDKLRFTRYIPFCPRFIGDKGTSACCCRRAESNASYNMEGADNSSLKGEDNPGFTKLNTQV